jgi:hypothetical protein
MWRHPHFCCCEWSRGLREARRRLQANQNHPIYVMNGNEDARLDQVMTADDRAFYRELLAQATVAAAKRGS